MSQAASQRDAAAVGHLHDLTPIEASAVLYLRLWCEGPDAQAKINGDFRIGLGVEQSNDAYAALSRLTQLIVQNGRRPLMRHALECRCIGADESCFATMIASAAEKDHEDAMLLASIMVNAQVASVAAYLAFQVASALKSMTRSCDAMMAPAPQPEPIFH